jgi:hypothetical protein
MFKFLVLTVFFPAISAQTPIRSCGAGIPMPTATFLNSRSNPCLEEPCNVSRSEGSGVTYVDFTPAFNTVSIMPRIRATIFGSINVIQELPEEIARNP